MPVPNAKRCILVDKKYKLDWLQESIELLNPQLRTKIIDHTQYPNQEYGAVLVAFTHPQYPNAPTFYLVAWPNSAPPEEEVTLYVSCRPGVGGIAFVKEGSPYVPIAGEMETFVVKGVRYHADTP